jgi:electron transfer flavoprotein alpha subunit
VTVLFVAECEDRGMTASSAAALGFARVLAAAMDEDVTAVVFGSDARPAEFAGDGVAAVCRVSSARLTAYAPAAWAAALRQLAESCGASAVVAAATDRGSEVMAHLGAATGLPVAANCVAVRAAAAGNWHLVRQRWAGSVLEDAVLDAPVALLTMAADALAADGALPQLAASEPTLTDFEPELDDSDLRVQATISAATGSGESLATARVVVGGGRGVGGPEGFAALEELAGLLRGVVGVSRVVTSAGWRPHRQQVGQTGTKISPEVYLACGISGAIQHMAGCLTAKHIIVVNTDPDAPIIARAEYAVIADLHELIPALVAAISARSRESGAGGDAPAAAAAGAPIATRASAPESG